MVKVIVQYGGESVSTLLSRVPVADEYLLMGEERETVQVTRVAHYAAREGEAIRECAAMVWAKYVDSISDNETKGPLFR